jgi:predicted Fe-Mo cluster-binding NifX family protein
MTTASRTIAFVTDDGSTISSHFGRALYYELITLQDGKVASRKRVEKAGHHSFAPHEQADGDHGHKHEVMTAPLTGVTTLIARGMGMGAQQHLLAIGIEPVLTDLHSIDEAVKHFLAGTLAHNPRRLHDHGTHQ